MSPLVPTLTSAKKKRLAQLAAQEARRRGAPRLYTVTDHPLTAGQLSPKPAISGPTLSFITAVDTPGCRCFVLTAFYRGIYWGGLGKGWAGEAIFPDVSKMVRKASPVANRLPRQVTTGYGQVVFLPPGAAALRKLS